MKIAPLRVSNRVKDLAQKTRAMDNRLNLAASAPHPSLADARATFSRKREKVMPGFILFSLLCFSISLMPPSVMPRQILFNAPLNDMSGRAVDLTIPARKVAILAPVLSSYAAIDEGLQHVTAISAFVRKTESKGVFGHIFPGLIALPIAGINGAIPDPELVFLLKPDAIVAWRVQAEALRRTSYPGLVELDYSSQQSKFFIWTLLGKIAGREVEATSLWQRAEARRQNLQILPPQIERARVLPMAPNAGAWWIGGKNYNLNALIEQLGAVNPAHDLVFYGPTEPEEILRYDPDVIVMPALANDAVPKQLYDDPQWQALRAVRQKRVYRMPVNSAFNVPVDETLVLNWLAEILHPTLPHATRTAYREIYAQAYHYDLSDDEIDDALFVRENAGSAAYERFTRER